MKKKKPTTFTADKERGAKGKAELSRGRKKKSRNADRVKNTYCYQKQLAWIGKYIEKVVLHLMKCL